LGCVSSTLISPALQRFYLITFFYMMFFFMTFFFITFFFITFFFITFFLSTADLVTSSLEAGVLATLAFFVVFKVLIKLFFSMDMVARLLFKIFVFRQTLVPVQGSGQNLARGEGKSLQ
jgi:hypothetical protein